MRSSKSSDNIRIHTIPLQYSTSYIIEGSEGVVLVDAGWPGKEHVILRKMEQIGRNDLRLIFITHGHLDHYGSAAALRRCTAAPIAIHHLDAAAMGRGETPLGSIRGIGHIMRFLLPLGECVLHPEPTVADVYLHDGDSLDRYGIPARILHTPGHTPGSSSLMIDTRFAFVGDLITHMGVAVSQRLFASNWQQLGESIRRLQELGPAKTFPGHGNHPVSLRSLHTIKPPRV